ncbi:MAG: hypothetical protein CMA31_02050 [Euryarchaeota archaeon]|nr:hypothetical protein [Euryarchaeota archaeon]
MAIKNFGFDDDLYDDNFQEQFETQEKVSPVVSQEQAQRAAQIANNYPNLPPSVVAAAAQIGIGFDDINLEQISKKVELQAEEKFNKIKRFISENPLANEIKNNRFFQFIGSPIDNILKPTIRGTASTLLDAYEVGYPAIARAKELQDQNPNMSYEEAYKIAVQGTTRAPKVQQAIQSGDSFDLGRGWLKLSTDPSDTEEYKKLIAAGHDPIYAREYVLKEILGDSIDEDVMEQARTVVQFQGELGKQFKNAGLVPSVSPGRKVFKDIGGYDVFEPGTKAAHLITGALDIGFNLLDPVNYLTFGIGAASKGKKMFKVAERLDDAGVITRGIRSTFHGPTLQAYLASSKGAKFKKLLWDNADNPFEIITKTKESITDAQFFADLKKLKEGTPVKEYGQEAEKLLDGFLQDDLFIRQGLDKANNVGSSRLIEATNMYVPQVVRRNGLQQRLKLQFSPSYGRLIDANDPQDVLRNLYRFTLQSKAFLKQSKEGQSLANKLLNDTIDVYNQGGDINMKLANVVANWLEQDFRKVLIQSGVNKSVAKAATKVTRQFSDDADIAVDMNKGKYGMFSNGKDFNFSQTLKDNGVDANTADEISRALFSTQLNNNIFLPELNQVVKASNQMTTKLRGNMTKLVDKVGGENSESFIRVLDWYNSDIFKPLALLKPAWTVKVIGEEQLRLVSRGISNGAYAPIQMIARVFGRSVGTDEGGKLSKGVDPLLPSEATGGYWASDLAYDNALTGINNVRVARRKKVVGARWGAVGRGQPEYNASVVRTVYQMINDEIAVKIATIEKAENLTVLQKKEFLDIIADQLKNGPDRARLEKVVGDVSHPFHKALTDDEVAKEYVYYLRASLHQQLGGNVVNKGASAFDWVESLATTKMLDVVASKGLFTTAGGKKLGLNNSAALVKSKIKTKKKKKQLEEELGDVDFEKLANDFIAGKVTDEEFTQMAKLFSQSQNEIADAFIGTFYNDLPSITRGEYAPQFKGEGLYNKTIDSLFNTLMTVPTNKLSRSPAFRRLYWQRVSETIEFLGKDARDEMINIANKSLKEFTKYDPKLRGYLNKINKSGYSGPKEAITDVNLYDKMVASDALTQTKKLLYDISERTVIGDSLRFAFPFLEAYLEIFKTWTDITKKQGGKNLVNLNKLVQSGSEPNPLADPTGQRGFFYTNPVNGEEVFAYPGTGLIQKYMFPEFQDTGVEAEFPVYVSSINLVADIMPGIGPIIRFPASYFRERFPEEGFINRTIFGDFGPPRNLIEGLAPFPAWAKKFYSAYKQGGTGSADLNRLFNNTVIDTYKALIYAGAIDDSSPEGAEQGLELATSYARRIFAIRGVSQLLGPSGSAAPLWTVTDKSGNSLFIESLADTYRDYKAANDGDDYEATARFIKEFGLDPTAMLTSKSKSVVARPQTVFAAQWARDNEDLYDDFNSTAFYLTPTDINSKFSYDAYLNALDSGTLVPRTPGQWILAKNRLLGSIAYENFLRNTTVGGTTLMNTNTETAQLLKWTKQSQLMQQYWGYGQNAGFEMDKPDTDFLLQEMGGQTYLPDRTSSFTQGWIKSDYTPIDKLKDNNAAIAYGLYRKEYDKIVAEGLNRGYSPTSIRSSRELAPARAYLRKLATKLISDYPEFGPLYNSILENELREEVADAELLGF